MRQAELLSKRLAQRAHLRRMSWPISGGLNSTLPSLLFTRRLPRFSMPVDSTHFRTWRQNKTGKNSVRGSS